MKIKEEKVITEEKEDQDHQENEMKQKENEEVSSSLSPLSAASPLRQEDLDNLRNLTLYYSNLSGTKNNMNNKSKNEEQEEQPVVESPTPDEVILHRRYLLSLLQRIKHTKDSSGSTSSREFSSNNFFIIDPNRVDLCVSVYLKVLL